jgi:hypothetical protein
MRLVALAESAAGGAFSVEELRFDMRDDGGEGST